MKKEYGILRTMNYHDCTLCGETDLSKFHNAGIKKNGTPRLHSNCKECRKGMQRIGGQKKTSHCSCGKPKYPSSKMCRSCSYTLTGPNSRSWKRVNGKTKVTPDGYVWECREYHPHAAGGGWVAQHRLRMEESLGRHLFPNENVHHLNGVKSDNRVENLELWVTSQPSGQRPDDLLKWADEIIQRYRMPL